MHVLTVIFKQSGALFELYYDDTVKAHDAYASMKGEGKFELKDEYGGRCAGDKADVAFSMVINLAKKIEAKFECDAAKEEVTRRKMIELQNKPKILTPGNAA